MAEDSMAKQEASRLSAVVLCRERGVPISAFQHRKKRPIITDSSFLET